MKIGINVSWMTPGHAGGMEWYVRCLIAELGKLDPDPEYLLVAGPANEHTFAPPGPRWEKVVYCGPEHSPEAYRGLPEFPPPDPPWRAALKKVYHRLTAAPRDRWYRKSADLLADRKVDVWFCPFMFALPVDAGVPTVVTIPDLQHEYYPQFFDHDELALRRLGYQYSCRAAAATLGISRHVADEIVRLYGVPAERVFGIPLALDPVIAGLRDRAAELAARVRAKFHLDREFAFYPANGWPHKNHDTLVRAMARVARRRPGLQLVLTGCSFELRRRLQATFHRLDLLGVVRHIGYVTREEVAGLHAAARLLVFPSRFEGFGLPLLEAMHFGVPVACSNIGSLPEVGGDAVQYFDPLSEEQVADAILALADEAPLRARLAAAGREQAARFSYARTAARTLDVFRRVHDGTLPRPQQPPFEPLLAPSRALKAGRGRWYFRLKGLRQLRLQVVPEAAAPQHLEVRVDGRRVLDAPLEPRRPREFVLAPVGDPEADYHTLEVSAAGPPAGPGLPLRVPRLVAVDSSNQELRFVA
jgi:glycosyltransferase involved in cell wall biosynthesis